MLGGGQKCRGLKMSQAHHGGALTLTAIPHPPCINRPRRALVHSPTFHTCVELQSRLPHPPTHTRAMLTQGPGAVPPSTHVWDGGPQRHSRPRLRGRRGDGVAPSAPLPHGGVSPTDHCRGAQKPQATTLRFSCSSGGGGGGGWGCRSEGRGGQSPPPPPPAPSSGQELHAGSAGGYSGTSAGSGTAASGSSIARRGRCYGGWGGGVGRGARGGGGSGAPAGFGPPRRS